MGYERDLEMLQQRMADKDEEALIRRLEATCPDAEPLDAQAMVGACVNMMVAQGRRGLDARLEAIQFLERSLDRGAFNSAMDVMDMSDWPTPPATHAG